MDNVTESKTYELAYHITPDTDEAGVKSHAEELTQLIAQHGGTITRNIDPKRTHLSYPVKHKQYSYFGIIDFDGKPDIIDSLNGAMKLQGGVLRYLILKKPEGAEIRTLGEYRARSRVKQTHEAQTQETQKAAPKEKTEEEIKQLEQEIEKVIEGL